MDLEGKATKCFYHKNFVKKIFVQLLLFVMNVWDLCGILPYSLRKTKLDCFHVNKSSLYSKKTHLKTQLWQPHKNTNLPKQKLYVNENDSVAMKNYKRFNFKTISNPINMKSFKVRINADFILCLCPKLLKVVPEENQ
jgi:hypothetical protein